MIENVSTFTFSQNDNSGTNNLLKLLKDGWKINNYTGYPIAHTKDGQIVVESWHSFVLIKEKTI